MFYNTDLTYTSETVNLLKGYLVLLGRFCTLKCHHYNKGGEREREWWGGGGEGRGQLDGGLGSQSNLVYLDIII